VRNDSKALRPFEAELLTMLAQAARETIVLRRAPRLMPLESRWGRAALVTVVGLSLALAVPFLTDDPLRGALAIDRRGETIFVSVKDASADPKAMTNDLRAKGLPAKVETLSVSPSLEGAWVDIVNDNLSEGYNDPRISKIFEQITKRPEVLELPADFSTPFTLVVGRPAEPGEIWVIAMEADVLGAYKCLGLEGLTPTQVEERLTAQGYETWWSYHRSKTSQTDQLDEVPADKVIIGAEFHGPSTVIVHTADPHSPVTHDSASQDQTQTTCHGSGLVE
jgi:hypothetical protein